MSKLEELESLLAKHGFWAKKHLGQNFLIDETVFETILEAADLQPSDNVVEVGPGTGFLTEHLLEEAKHVTAVETDGDMIKVLKSRFREANNLELIHKDILKVGNEELKVKDYKVVANIPYYITSPLLKYFLQSENPPQLMVVLVQKEVAEKICGITGKSLITIETQLFGKPELVGIVPPKAFHPSPKVDSAILKIEAHPKPLVPSDKLKDFLRVVKFGFSQKRKKLTNSLGAGLHMKPSEVAPLLERAGIDPGIRAEALEIEDWKRLVVVLTKDEK
jgi:16S rRNA (adenine1518-N6/adenine1519-N6)-dimethyltransferase